MPVPVANMTAKSSTVEAHSKKTAKSNKDKKKKGTTFLETDSIAVVDDADSMEVDSASVGGDDVATSDFSNSDVKKGVLSFFYDLASVDDTARVNSACGLIDVLKEAQAAQTSTENAVCSDVDYCLKRLIRGTASSRLAARQGFVVALTELLVAFPMVKIQDVLDLMEKSLAVTGGMKGQESRDNMFGRVFGYSALLRSGRCTMEEVQAIVGLTSALSNQKTYLKPACALVVVSAIEQSQSRSQLEERIMPTIAPLFAEDTWSVETLSYALTVQRLYPELDYGSLFKGWSSPNLLHSSNFSRLQSILVQSTEVTQSGIHFIWRIVIDELLTHELVSETKKIGFESFWEVVVDLGLLQSTSHDRKYVGLQLFNEMIVTVPTQWISCMLTPTLLRLLINNLSKEDAYLHGAAMCTITAMRNAGAYDSLKAVMLVSALQGPQGHRNFDQVSGSNCVDTLVNGLTTDGINAYLDLLMQSFLNPPEAPTLEEKNDTGAHAAYRRNHEKEHHVNVYREWVVNQMLSLCRNRRLPRTEQWVMRVVRFTMLHTHFVVSAASESSTKKSSSKKSKFLELLEIMPELETSVAAPAVSPASHEACGKRLVAMMSEVSGWPHLDGVLAELGTDTQAKDNKKGKPAAGHNKSTIGTMKDGEFWVHRLNEATLALYEFAKIDERVTIVNEENTAEEVISEKRRVMALAKTALEKVRQVEAKHETRKSTGKQKHAKALELLLLHSSLLLMSGEGEAVDVIEDLSKCVEKEFGSQSTGRTPNKENDDERSPAVVEVLTDCLLSLLAKPASVLRVVCVDVFKVYCEDLTSKGLDLLLQVLEINPGLENGDILQANADEHIEEDMSGSDSENDMVGKDGEVRVDESESEEEQISSTAKRASRGKKVVTNASNVENDSADDSESDSISDSDSDADDMELDEELKKNVREVLGDAAHDVDASGDEAELSDYDDEQMAAFDAKLGEVFRDKKNQKQDKRLSLQAITHFKLRVLDLIEVFIRSQSQNPLVLRIIMPLLTAVRVLPPQKENNVLKQRLEGVILNKLCKLKECPRAPALDSNLPHEVLDQLFTFARESADRRFMQLVTASVLLCLRVLIGANGGRTGPSPRKTRSALKRTADQANALTETSVTPSIGALDVERVATLYRGALFDYLTEKHTKLNLKFFTEPLTRYQALLDPMMQALASILDSVKRDYPRTQAFQIMECITKVAVSHHQDSSTRAVPKLFQPYIESTLTVMAPSDIQVEIGKEVTASTDEDVSEKAVPAVKGKHIKACVKSTANMYNSTKNFDGQKGVFADSLLECLETLAKNNTLAELTPSVRTMCKRVAMQMRTKATGAKSEPTKASSKRRRKAD
ncbi:hypothetical protein SARC_05730 [Sphaeroforma arctica JP610]|uniref:DNA polymerase V n=1 Tax=Sphaeroforma arctica JP610 TaxID=667725 RepID=A0A0L0FZJ2_9EUKA|nr:hypothetical protein SARC_05730 [Sphaeroforma arctica JP610]KNC81981.1 hypothetical protein SARC_05730 [Sphaeroforma arctica JP610]|eukprot:XP_014155883.1 hypothetical protein SARC_05730 [Sphaeroforma arctica JP610]